MRVDNERKRAYPAMREPPHGTRRRGNEKATAQTCPNASKVSRLILKLFSLCFVFGQQKTVLVHMHKSAFYGSTSFLLKSSESMTIGASGLEPPDDDASTSSKSFST